MEDWPLPQGHIRDKLFLFLELLPRVHPNTDERIETVQIQVVRIEVGVVENAVYSAATERSASQPSPGSHLVSRVHWRP